VPAAAAAAPHARRHAACLGWSNAFSSCEASGW
jgi:hypothetical protein